MNSSFARRLTPIRWIVQPMRGETRAHYRRWKRSQLRSGNSACRRIDTIEGGAYDPPYRARKGMAS